MINFTHIKELGDKIDELCLDYGIKNAEYVIKMPLKEIREIDEDSYLRTHEDENEYKSKAEELIFNFNNVAIIIKRDGRNNS